MKTFLKNYKKTLTFTLLTFVLFIAIAPSFVHADEPLTKDEALAYINELGYTRAGVMDGAQLKDQLDSLQFANLLYGDKLTKTQIDGWWKTHLIATQKPGGEIPDVEQGGALKIAYAGIMGNNETPCIPVIDCINQFVGWLVGLLITLMGYGIYFAQIIFDYILKYSITEFGVLASAAQVGWGSVRDIANVFFIFILLWVAIRTVLGITSDTKKLVLQVVLAALLINFSAVVARVIIDSGNVLTLMFWENAKGTKPDGTTNNIGERIVSGVKLQSIIGAVTPPPGIAPEGVVDTTKTTVPNQPKLRDLGFWSIIIQGLGAVVYMLIIFILLITASVLFLRRALYLVFLILVSPFAFLIYAFSGLSGGAKKWLDELLCQTYFAPVFMIFFSVSIMVVEKMGELYMAGPITLPAQITFFVISSALMYFSLIAANSLGCTGGTAISQWAGKKMSNMSTNSAAWLGRNTLGRASGTMAETRMAKWVGSKVPGGKMLYGGLDKMADAKFGGTKGFYGTSETKIKAKASFADRMGKDKRTGNTDPIGEEYKGKMKESLAKGGAIGAIASKIGAERIAKIIPGLGGAIRENVAAAEKVGKVLDDQIGDLTKEINDLEADLKKVKPGSDEETEMKTNRGNKIKQLADLRKKKDDRDKKASSPAGESGTSGPGTPGTPGTGAGKRKSFTHLAVHDVSGAWRRTWEAVSNPELSKKKSELDKKETEIAKTRSTIPKTSEVEGDVVKTLAMQEQMEKLAQMNEQADELREQIARLSTMARGTEEAEAEPPPASEKPERPTV